VSSEGSYRQSSNVWIEIHVLWFVNDSDLRALRVSAPGTWAFQLRILWGMRGNEVIVE
jgi:hypothetical protein